MRWRWPRLAVLLLPFVIAGSAMPMTCTGSAAAAAPPTPLARPLVPPSATPAGLDSAAVAAEVVGAVHRQSARAEVGLLVWDRASDSLLVSVDADRRLRSASLVKLLIAVRVAGEPGTGSRVTRMLRASDDAAASALWGLHGGDRLPELTGPVLGLEGLAAPDVPGYWGDTLLSPNDILATYRYFLRSAPELVDPMRAAPRVAADGFDQHFGIPSAFAGPWAVKQAWGSGNGYVAVHTTGVLGAGDRYVVLLMTNHPSSVSFSRAIASVTAGAKALAAVLPLA
ncbi:hypothetical protein V5P93_001317 [Actinokineospora auranticolor]|uniref:Beta-lactamase class A n=1 Tax=Actinokineospora auranticolor TaxID=155976 RepID=A0A2S6GUT0_9PSEU|nr:hypothetical protein [Actinokineospora auranticolor]PPK68947.1 hypothetical protein CLV40_104191 [Actinokineospora auranticolor]